VQFIEGQGFDLNRFALDLKISGARIQKEETSVLRALSSGAESRIIGPVSSI
jgi:hypothetical protein